jgi:hypothetical protein
MVTQFTFYFRFLLLLLWLELLAGFLVSRELKVGLISASTIAGMFLLVIVVGVRFGFLRRGLASLLQNACYDPESMECRQLHDACKRSGRADVHTADFIHRFEVVWNLGKNRRGIFWHGMISLLNSVAVSILLVMAVVFAAREFHLPTVTSISMPDKVALIALFITAVIISGGHDTLKQESRSSLYIFSLLALWVLLLVATVSCEGVLHYIVPLLYVNKLNLHRVHEGMVTAIAGLLLISHALVSHQRPDVHKLFIALHIVMLAGLFVLLWIEWGTHLGREKGELFFSGAILLQVGIHILMHVWEKVAPVQDENRKAFSHGAAH